MNSSTQAGQSPIPRDPLQEKVHQLLLQVGPGPAEFYSDACQLMAGDQPLSAVVHLVGHCLREIESSLLDVLAPFGQNEPPSAAHPADGESPHDIIARTLRQHGVSETYEVWQSVDRLAKDQRKHKDRIRAVLNGLGFQTTDPVADRWLNLAGESQRYAHRANLDPPRPVDEEFRNYWNRMNSVFSNVLAKLEFQYSAYRVVLDNLLSKQSPTQKDVKALRSSVPNTPYTLHYFFARLQNPAWLPLLCSSGFFKQPPEPVPDPVSGAVTTPDWPQSQYLVHIAAHAPQAVLDIARGLAETTNGFIHCELADAACLMPPKLAAVWAEAEAHRIDEAQGDLDMRLPNKLAALIRYLALSEQTNAAMHLLRALVTVCPPASSTIQRASALSPRIDTWQYADLINETLPSLVESAGETVLTLLMDVLDEGLGISEQVDGGGAPIETSERWRPAIAHTGRSFYQDNVLNTLVSAIRDTGKQLGERDPSYVPRLVAQLEARSWRIFQRLALWIVATFAEAHPALVAERVTDQGRMNGEAGWPEFGQLLQAVFPRLRPEEQGRVLELIDAGPDESELKRRMARGAEGTPTPEQTARFVHQWQVQRLALIHDHLPQAWLDRLKMLCDEYGLRELPGVQSWPLPVFGGEGPHSPKTLTELQSMSLHELLDFLASYQPGSTWKGLELQGLASQLAAMVTARPDVYDPAAERFRGLNPTYIQWYIHGLFEAAHQKRSFPWGPVLRLCLWVVETNGPGVWSIEQGDGTYRQWNGVRQAITWLLWEGLDDGASMIPFSLRKQTWHLLELLSDDPQPGSQDEAGSAYLKPTALARSTVRGSAMENVMRYALWCRRHHATVTHLEVGKGGPFAGLPEVDAVLVRHLDPALDPSPVVRSVYGEFLPDLLDLDSDWTARHVEGIFPKAPGLRHLNDAAWDRFLFCHDPAINTFELLRKQYREAAERTSYSDTGDESPNHVGWLTEHLVLLYWEGQLSLNEHSDPIVRFFECASPDQKRAALECVGGLLSSSPNPMTTVVTDRLVRLWDYRIKVYEASLKTDQDLTELREFGWWFASGRFDAAWAITQLQWLLARWAESGSRDAPFAGVMTYKVLKQLATLASQFPVQSVECLEPLLCLDRSDNQSYIWPDLVRSILSSVGDSEIQPARQKADQVRGRLAARGHWDM